MTPAVAAQELTPSRTQVDIHYLFITYSEDKPTILVFNKIDAYNHIPKHEDDPSPMLPENTSLEELKKTWMSKLDAEKCIFISAEDKLNIEELKEAMYSEIKRIFAIRYPYNSFLY